MEKKIANKWVKALRSGKFKQANMTLISAEYDDNGDIAKVKGHCCLGVLAEISGLNEDNCLVGEDLLSAYREECGIASDEGSRALAQADEEGNPQPIRLRTKTGETKSFSNLAEANDSGISFKRIASWIEKNYKDL